MPLLGYSNDRDLQRCLFWEFIKEETRFYPGSRSQEDTFPSWILKFPTPLYTSMQVHVHMLIRAHDQSALDPCCYIWQIKEADRSPYFVFFCGWLVVWGKRLGRMLTRGLDVVFQKNTFLSLASVCLCCQDPLLSTVLNLAFLHSVPPRSPISSPMATMVVGFSIGTEWRKRNTYSAPQQAGEDVSNASHSHMSTSLHI